ncbi:MAG TPA: trypsin-like peptidase domain-containing protein [Terriglobales bacterium]|jgi:S1-C subfamily serine protease|nr:trypsin-like peptidase domain-containing protein [Terriglobales bacterium]
MRGLRVLLLALLVVGAFYFYTTAHRGTFAPGRWLGGDSRAGNLELTEAAGPEALDPEEQVNVSVYKKGVPSVVNIKSRSVSFNFFYGVVPEEGQGSGFILDSEGHVLTNFHVVANARQIEATLYNRKTYKADLIGVDRAHDLAVIQIHGSGFTPATLGNSRGLLVGQKVFAIGNPFGLSGTMTRGIVSSIRSVQEPGGAGFIDEAIQTDAAINPGNSGGPLLNSKGEVIGINTLIASNVGQSAGIGFAIPINTAKAVLGDLVSLGRVRRPSLGVHTIPIGPELAAQLGLPSDYGLLINDVISGSAAERAGLRGGSKRALLGNTPIMIGGDLIVAIDGQAIEDPQDLSHIMNNHRAGDTVTVTIYRGSNKMDVKVTLGEAREQA